MSSKAISNDIFEMDLCAGWEFPSLSTLFGEMVKIVEQLGESYKGDLFWDATFINEHVVGPKNPDGVPSFIWGCDTGGTCIRLLDDPLNRIGPDRKYEWLVTVFDANTSDFPTSTKWKAKFERIVK